MSVKPLPRPLFLTAAAYAVVLAAFVVLTLTESTPVRLVTTLLTLGSTGFVAVLMMRAMFAETDQRPATRMLPCPKHLRVEVTGRGFGHFPALPDRYGGPEDISVSESSNAEYAGIWLRVAGQSANLTAGTAWRLAEQLAVLVANHYHGDQRPDSNETILSVDLARLDTREEVDA